MVVGARNFVDDTWFGEDGYCHTDAMRVIERMWKDGDNLVWQATVEDPTVLTAPWTMPARVTTPSTEALEESPKCVESDGKKILNDDHHLKRERTISATRRDRGECDGTCVRGWHTVQG